MPSLPSPGPISFILMQFSAKILPNNFVQKSGVGDQPPRPGTLRPTTVKSKYFNLNKIKRKQFRKTFVQSNFSCNIHNLPCLAFTIEQSFQNSGLCFRMMLKGCWDYDVPPETFRARWINGQSKL